MAVSDKNMIENMYQKAADFIGELKNPTRTKCKRIYIQLNLNQKNDQKYIDSNMYAFDGVGKP